MAEMGGIANYGGSAAAMVDIVDEKTMKPNETSLGGNKLAFVFCACGGGGWRLASCQNVRSSYVLVIIKNVPDEFLSLFMG